MVERPKKGIALGQPIWDWLEKKVEAGEYASIGWAMEHYLREAMREEESKKK